MAGADRYLPLPMIADISEPGVPPHFYALTGPSDWRPALSRKVFHETVHYWQHISQGALIRLVEEDWERLRHFNRTRQVLPVGPLKRAQLQVDPIAGFNGHDLVECHARFWDVQVLGPPNLIEMELDDPRLDTARILTRPAYERLKAEGKIWKERDASGRYRGYSSLSFDLAMRMAAGRYARPYLQLLQISNPLVAAALFPLCAHFALHSLEPVPFFLDLVRRLIHQVDLAPNGHIEDAWRPLYPQVLSAALQLHLEKYGREFVTGQALIHRSPLYQQHPGYRMAYAMQSMACEHLLAARDRRFLIGPAAMPAGMNSLWTLDWLLGCCGMTDSRAPDLLAFLAPPAVRFADGTVWRLGELFDALPYREHPPATAQQPPPRKDIATALLAIDSGRERMQEAMLGF